MCLPTAYLVDQKNLDGMLDAIRAVDPPRRFTVRFLESLGFRVSSDLLVMSVLKSLTFLDNSLRPTDRYFRFLDRTQSDQVLAESIRDAYADVFAENPQAHQLNRDELIDRFRTLTGGRVSQRVIQFMAATFNALTRQADFTA